MSLINEMLKDLDQRQASPVYALNPALKSDPTIPYSAKKIGIVLLFVLVVVLIIQQIGFIAKSGENSPGSNHSVVQNSSNTEINDDESINLAVVVEGNGVDRIAVVELDVHSNENSPTNTSINGQSVVQMPTDKDKESHIEKFSAVDDRQVLEKTSVVHIPETSDVDESNSNESNSNEINLNKTATVTDDTVSNSNLISVNEIPTATINKDLKSEQENSSLTITSISNQTQQTLARNYSEAQRLVGVGAFEQALTLLNDNIYSHEHIDTWLLAGLVSQKLGKYESATIYYSRLVELDENRPDFWLGLGIALESLAKFDAALRSFEKAESVNGQLLVQNTAKTFRLSVPMADYVYSRIAELRSLKG